MIFHAGRPGREGVVILFAEPAWPEGGVVCAAPPFGRRGHRGCQMCVEPRPAGQAQHSTNGPMPFGR